MENMVSLAVIVDGKVQEIFKCDERFGAILLSSPIIVDVTGKDEFINQRGLYYDEKANLFYKKIDLANQYRTGIRVYPHEDGEYDHSAAEILFDDYISKSKSIAHGGEGIIFDLNEESSSN